MNDTVIMARPTGHPLAGQQMTGAQMLVQVLADEGVTFTGAAAQADPPPACCSRS